MIVKKIILNAIENINKDLLIKELDEINECTRLFELIDSLGTLDLILELESMLEEETGHYVAVADEYSMDKNSTPFRTILTLEKYILDKVNNASA